jgi:hypothetical protein
MSETAVISYVKEVVEVDCHKGRAQMPIRDLLSGDSCWQLALPLVILFGTEPVAAQSTSQPLAPVQSSTIPDYKAESEKFQTRIEATARTLRDNPRYRNASPKYLEGVTEFVTGNMLFVLLHELGHTVITQMGLSVLGKMEDAADSFASQKLIRVGSVFSNQVLTDAARGWFFADRRDRKTGDTVAYYDEHGLNQQRAYQIVCYMVGSDGDKFKALATEVKLPGERQDTCAGDYSNAANSWATMLKPHRRMPDQPKAKIEVVYGPATGRLETIGQMVRSIQLLEVVAEGAATELVWPAPFMLEMQQCGFPNARWDLPSHKLILCYELAADFEELYRDFGTAQANGMREADSSKRRGTSPSSPAYKPKKQVGSKRK